MHHAHQRDRPQFPAALALPVVLDPEPDGAEGVRRRQRRAAGDAFEYPAYATEHPTGTGPYKFESWDRGQQRRHASSATTDYWGDKAKINKIIFKTIPDDNTRKQELQAGAIDGYDLVAPG